MQYRFCGSLPEDPALASAFDEHHAIVHEERVMDDVLAAHAADR